MGSRCLGIDDNRFVRVSGGKFRSTHFRPTTLISKALTRIARGKSTKDSDEMDCLEKLRLAG